MSDKKLADYYPPMNALAIGGHIPCLKCGAMVSIPMRSVHVEWHERNGHV